jgi:hypothetical protein
VTLSYITHKSSQRTQEPSTEPGRRDFANLLHFCDTVFTVKFVPLAGNLHPSRAPLLTGWRISKLVRHRDSRLAQYRALVEDCVDYHILIWDNEVEHATAIVALLVFWRLHDTMNCGFEEAACEPLHDFTGIDDHGSWNVCDEL